jgi:hypothetical protein
MPQSKYRQDQEIYGKNLPERGSSLENGDDYQQQVNQNHHW